jgi:CTP synthase
VAEWGVISMWDVNTIYKVPRMLHEQGLDGLICDKLQPEHPPANLKRWDDLVYETEHPQGEVTIAMVGKYTDLSDSYKSLNEALRHAGMKNHVRVKIDYVDSETITPDNVSQLANSTPCWCPAALASAASKARSARPALRARTRCPTWASAWACRWPPSSSRAMWPAWPTPTAPSLSPLRPTR